MRGTWEHPACSEHTPTVHAVSGQFLNAPTQSPAEHWPCKQLVSQSVPLGARVCMHAPAVALKVTFTHGRGASHDRGARPAPCTATVELFTCSTSETGPSLVGVKVTSSCADSPPASASSELDSENGPRRVAVTVWRTRDGLVICTVSCCEAPTNVGGNSRREGSMSTGSAPTMLKGPARQATSDNTTTTASPP